MKKIQINVFGTLVVFGLDGVRIPIAGNKQQALLSYLAVNPENPPSRDTLMNLLWGDRFNDQARQSLRQSISKLRQALASADEEALWIDGDRIGINTDMVSTDLEKFSKNARLETPDGDKIAVELFKGSLLDGLSVRENEFEEWLQVERNRTKEQAFPVFERLAALHLKNGDQSTAQAVAQQLIDIDPLRESSHRLLMRTYAQSGQRSAAIQQYNKCADMLLRELDVEPDVQTQKLLENIKSPTELPGTNSVQSFKHPKQTTELSAQSADTSSKVTLTILPFQKMGKDENLQVFTEGLIEDTIICLTKYRWLDVIASSSSQGVNVSTSAYRQLAADQNITYSIEGTVRKLAQKIRVTVQLVELKTGKYVWVHRYDRYAQALFDNPDELVEILAASLESELVAFEGEKAQSRVGEPLGAWDCYHLALVRQYEFSVEGNARAQSLFRRAIELDPMFAAAYARLAYAMVLSAIYFDADQNSGLLEEALELSSKAVRLDDQDAIARFALGRTHLAMKKYEQSIVEMQAAIDLNSSLAQAYCGLGDSLSYLGRVSEAIPSFEEAVRLSPHDPHRWAFLMYAAIANIFNGDYETAVEWAKSSVQVPNSHYWASAALVSALGHMDRKEETQIALESLIKIKPDFTCRWAAERLFYLRDQAQIDRYIDGLKKAGVPA